MCSLFVNLLVDLVYGLIPGHHSPHPDRAGTQDVAADGHRPGREAVMRLLRNEPAQRLLWNMSYWNDRVRGWLFNPDLLARGLVPRVR